MKKIEFEEMVKIAVRRHKLGKSSMFSDMLDKLKGQPLEVKVKAVESLVKELSE